MNSQDYTDKLRKLKVDVLGTLQKHYIDFSSAVEQSIVNPKENRVRNIHKIIKALETLEVAIGGECDKFYNFREVLEKEEAVNPEKPTT
jgi:phosphate uptake regulator